MAEKLFKVSVRNMHDGVPVTDQRLIRATGVKEIAEYLLQIDRANAEDVAMMMTAGVKLELAFTRRVEGVGGK